MKFTFKTDVPTGKWRSFDSPYHNIKLKKKKIGNIDDNKPHYIRFAVIKKDINEDGNLNCEWKWIKLKHKSESVQDAKDFLNENIDEILLTFDLYYFEN